MNKSIFFLYSAFATFLLASCAVKPDAPVVNSVCLTIPQETAQEVAYVRRKAAQYLQEYGFKLADTGCEVSINYEVFGGFQGEIVSKAWIQRSGYWSQEGILTIKHLGSVITEDEQITLRGYAAKQDLLDALAWRTVKPVTRTFRPASEAGRSK